MPFRSATKREMSKAIADYCEQKCPFKESNAGRENCDYKECPLWQHRVGWVKEPDPMHLFKIGSFKEFTNEVVAMALTFRDDFTFSDIRGKLLVEPLHAAWWGSVTKTPEWRESFVWADKTRPSASKRRNGGRVGVWSWRTGSVMRAYGG